MKRGIGTAIVALTGFATLAEAQTVGASRTHYAVTNLGSRGFAEQRIWRRHK